MKVVKSRNNVYYDIEQSPYVVNYMHMSLWFTSENNRRRFVERLTEHNISRLDQYSRQLRVSVGNSFNYLATLILYMQIEKRDFKVTYKGRDIDWHNLVLELEIKTLSGSKDLTPPPEENKHG